MNIGGTEKSLLNILNILPKHYEVTILLLENKIELLKDIPLNVKIEILENESIYNYLQNTPLINYKISLKQFRFIISISLLINYLKYKITGNSEYLFIPLNNKLKINPINNVKYDIAVAYAGPHDFITYYILNFIKAEKKIQWIHFDVLKIHLNHRFIKKFYPKFNKIYCVSEGAKNSLMSILDNNLNIEVFKTPLNKERILKLSKEKNAFNDEAIKILTVGRLTHEKGHFLFMNPLKRLINEGFNLRWYIIGDGSQMNFLKKTASDLDILNYVVFVGTVYNPYPYYNECDIYIQPSLHEGDCITLSEAKLFNKPILTTDFISAKEKITHYQTGLIADINEESLYINMRQLLLDYKLRESFKINLEKEVFHEEFKNI